MRRHGASLATLALGLGLLAATPSAVNACSSPHPTFVDAVRGARAIARVSIVEGSDSSMADPTSSQTYRVERLLKGALPGLVTLDPDWTSLCRDRVGGYVEGSVGKTAVLAIEVRYYDQTIHPVWMIDVSQGLWGTPGVPPHVTTMDALEAAILAELGLPDTSTNEAAPRGAPPLAFILAAALVAFVAMVRKRGGRLPDRSAE